MHRKNCENDALKGKYSIEVSDEFIDKSRLKDLEKDDKRDGSFSAHMVRKMFEDKDGENDYQ